MGETLKLRNSLAGGLGLNDFLQQGDGQATIGTLLTLLLPTVNMRDFQRRYLFDTGSQSLAIGERISLVRWTVPANEYWKPLQIIYQNADAALHGVIVLFSMVRNPAGLVWQPVRTNINLLRTKIIYGVDTDGSATGGSNDTYNSKIPVTMEPGDTIDFTDLTVNVGASVQRWIFAYELVPAPATARTPGVVGAVTVV